MRARLRHDGNVPCVDGRYSTRAFPSRLTDASISQADSLTPPRYRSGGTSLFNLEEAECCNVNNPLFETCQEKDIGISFDSQGWAECQVDHYMVGLRRKGGWDCQELHCLEGLSCCKGAVATPPTPSPSSLHSSIHSVTRHRPQAMAC